MIKKLSITTNMNTMNTTKGLTLIELMVTLAVLAILVSVGLPKLSGMSSGNRMSSTINTLASDLALARSEAINRNRLVRVIAQGGVWADGWRVEAPGGILPLVVLNNRGPVPNGMNLTEDSGGILVVTYGNNGLKTDTFPRTFNLCAVDRKNRIININPTGRYTTSTAGGISSTCP